MEILFTIFIRYGAFVPICIVLGSYFVRHYINVFPNKLIPILNILVAVSCMVIWTPLIKAHWPISLRIFNGILYGLSATGLHQLIKQFKSFIRMQKYRKLIREKLKLEEESAER